MTRSRVSKSSMSAADGSAVPEPSGGKLAHAEAFVPGPLTSGAQRESVHLLVALPARAEIIAPMRIGKLLAALFALTSAVAFAKPPRLTLVITVDAFGTDVLQRMRPRLKGGVSQLLNQGAFFPTARYEYAKAVTSAGHTTLATGANPWRHGV